MGSIGGITLNDWDVVAVYMAKGFLLIVLLIGLSGLLTGCQHITKKYEFSNSTQQERAASARAIALQELLKVKGDMY